MANDRGFGFMSSGAYRMNRAPNIKGTLAEIRELPKDPTPGVDRVDLGPASRSKFAAGRPGKKFYNSGS